MTRSHKEGFNGDYSNSAYPPRACWRRRARRHALPLCVSALVVLSGHRASSQGQAGRVDSSFTPSPTLELNYRAMTLAPDGSVILASYENDGGASIMRMRRLDEHGGINTNFHAAQFGSSLIDCLTPQPDGGVLVCGYFTTVDALPRQGLVRLRPDGIVDTGFDPGDAALGAITAMAAQANGKVIVAGRFSTFNGVSRAGVARLNANGSLDQTFNPGTGANSPFVNAVAVQADGKVMVGGSFSTFNAVSRQGVVRLNVNGSVDPGFVPALFLIGEVQAVAVQPDGKIIVSGSGLVTGGETPNVVRLTANGSLDSTFQPGSGFGQLGRYVDSLALQSDGKILVGGDFKIFGGVEAEGVVRLNADGTLDPRYDPGGNFGEQLQMHIVGLQPNGALVVLREYVGDFGHFYRDLLRLQGGDTSAYAGRLQFAPIYYDVGETSGNVAIQVSRSRATTGVAEVVYGTRSTAMVSRAVATAGLDYVARTETLTLTNGQTNATILIPILDDQLAEPPEYFSVMLLEPGLGTTIGVNDTASVQILENDSAFEFSQARYSVRESSGKASVGVVRRGITTEPATVQFRTMPESASTGADFTAQSGTLTFLPGESLQGIDIPVLEDASREGLETLRVVLENPTGGVLLTPLSNAVVEITDNDDDGPGSLVRVFEPKVGQDSFSWIDHLASYPNGDVLVAGNIEPIFGPSRTGMIRIHPDGTPDDSFQLDPTFAGNTSVMLLQPDGRIVYAQADGLARLNPDGSKDSSFDVGLPQDNWPFRSWIAVLAQDNQGRLLVGGAFRSLAGGERTGLARLNTDGTLDLTFHPLLASTNRFADEGPSVLTIAVQNDNKIVIAGAFDSIDETARQHLARLNPDGSLDTTFEAGRLVHEVRVPISPGVTAMAVQPDGKLLLAGDWPLVRGVRGHAVIRLQANGAIDPAFVPALVEADVFQIAQQSNGKILLRLEYASLQALHRIGLARLNADGSSDPTFDPGPSFDRFYVRALLVEPGGDLLVAGDMVTVDEVVSKLVRLRQENANGFGRCEFHQPEFTAWESNGVATITVNRHAGALGAATVRYAATDGTAANGLDFLLTPGSVTFSPGETSKTFNVTILKERVKPLPDQLTLQLEAGPGAVLGSQSNATVTILRHPGGLLDASFEPRTTSALYGLPGEKLLTRLIDFLADDGAESVWSRLTADGIWEAGFEFEINWTDWVANVAARGDGLLSLYSSSGALLGRVARANADGTIDPTFERFYDVITAMTLEPGGKLLLNRVEEGEHRTNRIVRVNVDGSMDASFFSPIADNPDNISSVRQLVLQADGKIVVGGFFSRLAGVPRQNLARLHPDGSLDASFAPTAVNWVPDAMVLQSDGKIVVAQKLPPELGGTSVLRRLHADGSLDATFHAELSPWADVRTLLVQGDGKILVGGLQLLPPDSNGFEYLGMIRFGPSGVLDLTFASTQEGLSALLQADGRVVVAGSRSLVRLLNDSGVGAGRVGFERSSFHVNETGEPTIALTVQRTGGNRGAVSVNLGTTGTATEGADFSLSSDVIRFADGDSAPKSITIQIHEDTLAEGPETFRVLLGNPIGGLVLGQQSFVDIVIDDNDTAVAFSEPVYETREDAHEVLVQVRRFGAMERPFNVSLSTAPMTARPGLDYRAQNTVLSFAAGETNKSLALQLIDDGETESNETFRVVLSAPTAGVLLGTNAQALIVIRDDDRPGTLDDRFEPDPLVESYYYFSTPFASRLGIRCMAQQSNGRILLGGAFGERTFAFPPITQPLVRLLPNGVLDRSFSTDALQHPSGMPLEVTALAPRSDGSVWVAVHPLPLGGNGFPDPFGAHLVLLGENGSLDASFQTTFEGESIDALAVDAAGRILAGGNFSLVNGVARRGLVRLFPDGRVDPSFAPGAGVVLRPYGRLNALAVQPDGRIVLAGDFSQVNGVDRNGVARLESNGAVDGTFPADQGATSPFLNWSEQTLLLQPDGRVIVAGSFTAMDRSPQAGVVRLQVDGTLDPGFTPGRIGFPSSLTFVGSVYVSALASARHGKLLMGGNFTEINGVTRNNLARLNSDGSVDLGFAPALGGWDVRVLAEEASGQILAGGMFSVADDIVRPGLARLNGGVFQLEFDSVERLASGRARLQFEMPRGQRWFMEGSSNLVDWLIVSPTPLLDIQEFTDPGAVGNNNRFYRAVKAP